MCVYMYLSVCIYVCMCVGMRVSMCNDFELHRIIV